AAQSEIPFSPSRERRQYRDFVTSRERRLRPDVREVERAERPVRQPISPGERTQPFDYPSDRCGGSKGQIDRVEAQTLRIAREEQYSDGDLGSGCSDHAWKLMEK